jgi:hypothetical protein
MLLIQGIIHSIRIPHGAPRLAMASHQAGRVDRVKPWQRVGGSPEAGQPMDSIRAECNPHWKSRWRRSWPPAHV